jgi:predicted phage terminase large subunit-like protein
MITAQAAKHLNAAPPPPEFTAEEIELLLQNLNSYTPEEQAEIYRIVEELEARKRAEACYNDLIEFCKAMQPDYKVGKHHRILADLLMEIEKGKVYNEEGEEQVESGKDRVCVNAIFPNVQLAQDSKSAGRWNTSAGGEYFACGVGSALAGRGAHLLLIDDPHNEQDIINGNLDVFDKAYEWFTYGARTRLMPAGRVAIVQTRWHLDDLTGRVVRDMAQSDLADAYEVVEFPAILEIENPDNPAKPTEKPLWPEFFNLDALYRTKASMPLFQWNAQYQQKPTAEEAAIVKREWWNEWVKEDPPPCEYIIMSLDAAAEKNNRADYTALTTWGVFYNEEENRYSIILLNSIKKRLEFPELKELAYGEFNSWEPDAFIVEKKSSGTPLYQEMRRMGLVVQEYTPHRGSGDKIARLNSVADIVSSGLVWVPQTRWAEELVEEVAGFPFMSHDDLVDSTIMALMRFRQGGFIRLPTDEPDEQPLYRRRGGYY